MKDNVHEEVETSVSGFPMNDVGILLAESSTNDVMDVISYMVQKFIYNQYLVITRKGAKISRSSYVPIKEKALKYEYNISILKQRIQKI
jgi:hypothetical protein